MTKADKRRSLLAGALLGVLATGIPLGMFVFTPSHAESASTELTGTLLERTYQRLDRERDAKLDQLREYLDRIKELAGKISMDRTMRRCFRLRAKYHRLQTAAKPPAQAVRAMETLAAGVREHYLQHYSAFHDILFVDRSGTVFFAVRRADHVGTSLTEGPLKESSLARKLTRGPSEAFVDYEHALDPDEPSAYFVEPAIIDGQHAGWFVMQLSIHKINDIFVRGESLGETGEVFLVNEDRLMLTDSRFRRNSSILKQHLSAENIRSKFAEGRGHKIVTDYRGVRAISSFDVCPVMDSRWLLIAKIDRAEVITDEYRRLAPKLRDRLVAAARTQRVREHPPFTPPQEAAIVEMDEFKKARPGETVVTYGVHTCTAIVVHLPGEFAYLGHASSYDTLYGSGDLDLVSHMLKRVRRYEIRPYRMRNLRAVVIAPHTRSIARAVDKLVDEGLFLSQIRFMHSDHATSGTVWHEVDTGQTTVHWCCNHPGHPTRRQRASDTPRLGDLAQKLIDY
jgi:hypothetical protein